MGVVYKRGTYWIDYRFQGRRKRKKIGPSKALAEHALNKILLEIAENRYLDIRRDHYIKFETFADEYLETHSKARKSYKTDVKILKMFRKVFGGRYLHEIKTIDIERYKSKRAQEVSKSTVNRSLNTLKSLFNKAVQWGKLSDSPAKSIKKFKENSQRLRFLEKEEINRLLQNCTGHIRPIVIIALNTGMRKGEILSLKWEQVDIQHKVLHLFDTKNGERRDIPLNQNVLSTLVTIPRHPTSKYIFCDKTGKPYRNVRKSFFTAVQKADIINLHFHDLRHTFASQLVMAGVDLNTVRELLGHKSLEMTLRYSHLSPNHKMQAVETLAGRLDSFWTPGVGEPKPVDNRFLATSCK